MKPLLSLLTVGQQSTPSKVCWYDKHVLIYARGRIWVYPEEWNDRTINRFIKTNRRIFTMYPVVERYRDKFKSGLCTFTFDGFYSRVMQPDRILIYKPLDLITSECPAFDPLVYLQLPDDYVFDSAYYTDHGFLKLTIRNTRTEEQYFKVVNNNTIFSIMTFRHWFSKNSYLDLRLHTIYPIVIIG